MGADERVPAGVAHKLHPGHVSLHERGAAPLAGLEHNHADRTPAAAHILEDGEHTPLRRVELERHRLAGELVGDADTFACPESEVFGVFIHKRKGDIKIFD